MAAKPKPAWRDFATILCGILAIYAPLSLFPAPDLHLFLFPWLHHIQALGAVRVFSSPFSNYSPPYLYLLALFSTFGLPDIWTIKLLAIAGVGWLAWASAKLAGTLSVEPTGAALLALLLPSAILNGPVLGQCDAFWTGCCLLAVACAIQERPIAMAAWAGAAFAFKAQAAFLAPFCAMIVIQRRAWAALLIPPLIFLLSVAPAAAAGWPLDDLLSIYLKQPRFAFVGDAPNLWAIPRAFRIAYPALFPIGYALAAAAAAAIAAMRRRDLLLVALLSSIALPFLLPKMMERYFFLADVLSLALAYSRQDRLCVAIAVAMQAASCTAIVAYLAGLPWLAAIAAAPVAFALAGTIRALAHAPNENVPVVVGRANDCPVDAKAATMAVGRDLFHSNEARP
jgi:Gpi18-like mannosyltransferase